MTTSAPGKLLLFGEHAVVYGYPCLVTAISDRLYLSEGKSVGDTRFIDAAVARWGRNQKFCAKSSFSGKYGFGSSSAVTVAALKALRPNASNKEIFETAYTIVLDIQGVGSGFDVAAATYGGTLYYVKNKTHERLNINNIPLIVGYTGIKSNTVDLVNMVAKKREQYPHGVDRIFQGIAKLVEEAKVKLIEGNFERVGRLMDFNQEYLRDLGVSSEKLEAMISAAKKAGAWGAKLSGAGGGDCMIALGPPEIKNAIQQAGGEIVNVTSNAPGVRIETTDNQEEMFIVVDKNDTILGYKTRYECHRDKTLIHRSVGTVVFNSKGEMLLLKRSNTKDLGAGLWDVSIGGHVNRNESYEDAAKREMMEEVGIDSPIKFHSKKLYSDIRESEMQVLFTTIYDGSIRLNKEEIDTSLFIHPNLISRKLLSKEIELSAWAQNDLHKLHL